MVSSATSIRENWTLVSRMADSGPKRKDTEITEKRGEHREEI
jgi:hypothetical protein